MNVGRFYQDSVRTTTSKFSQKKVFAGRTLIPVPIFWEGQVAWGKGKDLWSKMWEPKYKCGPPPLV